jgi:uncharacterized protein (DUF302 family)
VTRYGQGPLIGDGVPAKANTTSLFDRLIGYGRHMTMHLVRCWRKTAGSIDMTRRLASLGAAALLLLSGAIANPGAARAAGDDGVVRVKSAYSMAETVARLKQDVAAKHLLFFSEIDQAKLAADAGIKLRPSTLLVFGNPALGTLFITANPNAGLDWPVRLLISQDNNGDVWAAYTDFAWIARRYNITSRQAEFAMASKVIDSITASVSAR